MDMEYTGDFVRHRISQLRLEKNLSERELSSLISKSHSYIKDINRRRSLPTFEVFLSICECLEVTPAEFFDPKIKNPTLAKSICMELDRLLTDKELCYVHTVLKQLKCDQVKSMKRLLHLLYTSVDF